MGRHRFSAVGFAIAALAFVAVTTWRSARVALLPRLDASALGGAPVEEQRALWLAFDEVLQCEVLDPCLAAQGENGWSTPGTIAAVCGASSAKLKALAPPPGLAPKLRKNVDLLRDFWLSDLGDSTAAAEKLARGKRGGRGALAWKLDTCTPESLPARIDQVLGVVPPGAVPAKCPEIRRLRQAAGAGP